MVGILLALLCIYRSLALLTAPVELQLCGSQIPQRGTKQIYTSMSGERPVDPRVGLLTTRSSEAVPSGAAKTTGLDTGRATQHSVIRKRAFRRARRRAEQAGGTLYRGRWMSAESLGTVLRNPDTADVRPRTQPDLAPTRHYPRLRVRSYNVGGVTSAVYDYLHHWLTTECQEDVLILQELHWGCGRAEGTWQIPGWLLVVSADAAHRFSGVGVAISTRVVSSDHVNFRTIIPGRLLHVRCADEKKTLDIVAGYQWVRSETGAKSTLEHRSLFWSKLGALLHELPTRNLVVVGADFNTRCKPVPGLVGRGVLPTKHAPDAEFETLLVEHQLVLLNTWGRSNVAACRTFHHDSVSSQIDFIAMRRPTADRVARSCKPVDFDLAPWRGGAKHRALVASIPWRAGWTFHRHQVSTPRFSLPQLRQSVKQWDVRAQELQAWVTHTVQHACPDTTLNSLNQQMLMHCARLYPPTQHHVNKPSTQPAVIRSIQAMKAARQALQAHRDSHTLRGIFHAWRLHAVFQRRGRELRAASKESRRQWFEGHILEAEAAASRNDLGAVYRVINRLAPRKRFEKVRIRGADGELLGPRAEFQAILTYFRRAFDGAEAPLFVDPPPVVFYQEEVLSAISALKKGKAVPPTSAPSEVWSLCPELYAAHLTGLLNQACQLPVQLPSEVTDCVLSLLPKPNKTSKLPSDLRPLGLQDPSSKIVAIAVRERLQQYVSDFVNSKPQYAYITGKAIDGAISRVMAHCSMIREQLKSTCPTVHDRRAQHSYSNCSGGAMMSLDLSRAFDEVPREALRASLQHAGVPAELQHLIVTLHEQCVYTVTHKRQSGTFPMRKGVRQGCALSPLLFTLYTCHIYDVLVSRTSEAWAAQAATLFADDTHFAWTIKSISDLKFMIKCVRVTFQTFKEFGMTLNMDKSRIVLKLRGGSARRWLKAHTKRTLQGPVLQLGTPHAPIDIPRVHRIVYLGVVASYTSFEQQTYAHRQQAALACKHRLGRVLRSRRLRLKQRVRLHIACVRSSLLYGLHAVGINPAVARRLVQFDNRSLRALSRSPAFLSHESTSNLRRRLDASDPLQTLRGTLQRRIAKCTDSVTTDWFRAKLAELEAILLQAPATSPEVEDICTGVPCPDCGQYFLNVRIMRSHRARSHNVKQPRHQSGVLAADQYVAGGVDGMPTCKTCFKRFTRVEGLKKHLKKGCIANKGSSTCFPGGTVTVPSDQVPEAREELLGHSCRTPLTAPPCLAPSMPCAVDATAVALVHQPLFREQSAQNWRLPLQDTAFCAKLSAYCVLCGQWSARVKQHQRLMHPREWALHDAAISQCCSAGLRSVHTCSYCGAAVKQPGRHLKHCTVLYQASLAALVIAQDHADDGSRCGGSSPGAGRSGGDAHGAGRPGPSGDAQPDRLGRAGEGGGRGRADPPQVAETGSQGRKGSSVRRVARRLGESEAPMGVSPRQLLFGATSPAGQGHAGLNAGNGSSCIEARSRDPEAQDGHRLYGLYRYSGLGCLPTLRQTADNWQEQFAQGTVKSPLRLVLFMTMLQLLKNKAEELLTDEAKLQRCMSVGWTVEGPTALSPKWVYHSWDPSAKKQIVAETHPLAHAEALRQVDLLLHHAPQDGALKNFKTARRMSAKDSYTAEVLPWMVSIGLRGESSNICYNALKILSGSAIMKLIGVRIRPERGQEPQLIKQLKESYMGTTFCDWTKNSAPWNSDA